MKRLFPFALMGLGLLIIIGTGGYWILEQKIQHPTAAPLPNVVADLSLGQAATGEAAIAEFSQLHNEDFPLTSGAVGMYGPEHSITLWVAGAPLQLIADRLLVSMREKIASSAGSSPFLPVGERQDKSRTIFELDGMGQKHFYFQSGKLIIWMAVDPQSAEEALTEVMEFYP